MMNESEQTVERIIRTCRRNEYDAAISCIDDPELYLQLSSLRRGVLGWFPFRKEWNVLQIHAGFGSLTETVLDYCAHTDALEEAEKKAEALRLRYRDRSDLNVICSDLMTFQTEKSYNCIILEDIPESCTDYPDEVLKKITSLLGADGILLISYENADEERRFWEGSKNASGDGGDTLSLSRRFWLLPNRLFPQVVVSDLNRRHDTFDDRILQFDPWHKKIASSVLLKQEKQETEPLNPHEEAFRICVYSKQEKLEARYTHITRVFLSSDRGRIRSSAVCVYDDGVAEKIALYPQGATALEQQVEYLRILSNRGIRTLPQEFCNGKIRMPCVESKTLLWQLAEMKDRDALVRCFDRMRHLIILASNGYDEKTGILKDGFPDMIPFNIFCDRGEEYYFDQEFYEKDCPLGYILYRMLHYSYLHVSVLEELVPLEEMKNRYDLTDRWEEYAEKERQFLLKTRKMDLYRQIWKWHNEALQRSSESMPQGRERDVFAEDT